MAVLSEYNYLLAVGTVFAFLHAWNIGANDLANSWASSVSSRSVTYLQASIAAVIMEFAGAVGVGGRVADAIRTKIVDNQMFENQPALLMLGMVCAVMASAIYLTVATRLGMPVSTTHSVLGGVLGMGIAAFGGSGITWIGYKDNGSVDITKGIVQVFLAWIIAPILSGSFASVIFLITKHGVLLRENPARKALVYIPIYFWLTASLIVMLLLWEGGDYEISLTESQLSGVIILSGLGWGILMAIFLVPWIYRVAIIEDWRMRAWHIALGPLLWRRGEVPPAPPHADGRIRDFYEGYLTREELETRRERRAASSNDPENQRDKPPQVFAGTTSGSKHTGVFTNHEASRLTERLGPLTGSPYKSITGKKPDGKWHHIPVLFWWVKWAVLRGVDKDIISSHSGHSALARNIEEIHAQAQHFNNRAEYLYSFLQVMTAAAASFVHGANDVANAIGPYASIYHIWKNGEVPATGANVPIWILIMGGSGIVLGSWTYGYHIMSNLGNKLTLMSPSRGFAMELGSTMTIVLATRLGLPVSGTQCITGAIVGVGLCSGNWRAIN